MLIVLPSGYDWQLWAFLLFRALDIAKPPPIGTLDRRVGGGLGIMLDDWVAAAIGMFVLALIARISGVVPAV
jgi:phosphatidylglycerophosphatase A